MENRLCYKLRRFHPEQPEDDGVTELIIYVDRENWLQVGSVLRDSQGQLIAEYYFTNLLLNPSLNDDHFDRNLLK